MGARQRIEETTQCAPVDRIERWSIKKLVPYAKNPRLHSDDQVSQIANSMREFGQTQLIVVDEQGEIIVGHGRIRAAEALGWKDVAVGIARGWSPEQKRAYRVADNALALSGVWDQQLLTGEVGDLKLSGFNLNLLGFDNAELTLLTADRPVDGADPDAAPEPSPNPIVKRGDLWLLGAHRLQCGDSTKPEHVERVLAGVKPHQMVTDPPYGVEYDPNWRNEAGRSLDGTTQRIKSGKVSTPIGARAVGKVLNDDRCDWTEAWKLFPGDVAYVWHASGFGSEVQESLARTGLLFRSQIIWNKQRMVIGRGDYHWKHEACFYSVRKGKNGHWNGDRTQTTVWDITHSVSETGHSTQKPVECMKRPIENNSSPGQAVYDPFVGSGTTVIAAEMTSRCCYAIEIDPSYVQIAIARWQNFTGKKAILEGDGRDFETVKRERERG
jgi:DNA modification methylase